MDLQLGGAKVVISGGSQGIGLEVAKTFLEEGATVQIAARTESKINEALEQLSPFGSATGQVCHQGLEWNSVHVALHSHTHDDKPVSVLVCWPPAGGPGFRRPAADHRKMAGKGPKNPKAPIPIRKIPPGWPPVERDLT